MSKKGNSTASKIVLGTVQFGQEYGIANTKGKVSEEEVYGLLRYAQGVGIDTLDTAFDYGSSERVIGEYLDLFVFERLQLDYGTSAHLQEMMDRHDCVTQNHREFYWYVID